MILLALVISPGCCSCINGGKVKSVRVQGTTLNLDLEDGGTLEIETAGPTASVMVRDKNHQLDYAD